METDSSKMKPDTTNVNPADPERVNIHDATELDEYWVGYFEAARQSIVDAVLEVGERPADVYLKLGKSHD